ncbi:AvrD family protein [Streptomyces sp. NPDC088762]|uniref:AvrD family protein n=1 Tax=Streptomyces sp. NPDC088762 TaxID=3365891 RepID=UPI003816B91C
MAILAAVESRATRDPLHLENVSDYLGAPERRFFGEGYKRAGHRLSGITSGQEAAIGDTAATPTVTGTAAVTYPADWSRKGTVDQKPHLSTIDVLLLGVQLTEALLSRHRGLTEEDFRGSWLRRVRIKAGATPVEDDLAAVPVAARLGTEEPSPDAGRTVSVVDATVGALTIRVELDHPDVRRTPGRPHATTGPDRPFGDAYRQRRQSVEDVYVAPGRDRATALVRLTAWEPAAAPGSGTEGGYQPSAGLIDAFVVALQLGQVLLYELDGVSRADSDTLWMRSTLLEASSPQRPLTAPDGGRHPVTAELRDATRLTTRHGDTWRRADIAAELAGVSVICSVAHRLPA